MKLLKNQRQSYNLMLQKILLKLNIHFYYHFKQIYSIIIKSNSEFEEHKSLFLIFNLIFFFFLLLLK
jgi:hypothetical protein